MRKYGAEVIYPELSYKIVGILFKVHREIGRYGREKQYADLLERVFREQQICFKREYTISDTGNRVDFIIENKLLLELKAKQFTLESDYAQVKRYLNVTNLKLGLLINFREKHLKPRRILKRYL